MTINYLKKLLETVDVSLLSSDKFHLLSNNKRLGNNDSKNIPEHWVKIHFKTYPRFQKIYLSPFRNYTQLSQIFRKRFSCRKFSEKPIAKNHLFYLIHESAGLIKLGKTFDDSRRAYPSAGARYPLELYLIILKCNGIKKGLYHYNVKQNCLELLLERDFEKWIGQATGDQKWIKEAGLILIITGVLDRTRIKYGERGYRYILIEAGHLGQNIQLLATELGLGSCPIGGYIDSKANSLLDINLEKEITLYLIAVGNL